MRKRRFIAVTLVTILGGLAGAVLVAEASRPARSWEIGQVVPCIFEDGFTCLPPQR